MYVDIAAQMFGPRNRPADQSSDTDCAVKQRRRRLLKPYIAIQPRQLACRAGLHGYTSATFQDSAPFIWSDHQTGLLRPATLVYNYALKRRFYPQLSPYLLSSSSCTTSPARQKHDHPIAHVQVVVVADTAWAGSRPVIWVFARLGRVCRRNEVSWNCSARWPRNSVQQVT
jgi:hypothetical protein